MQPPAIPEPPPRWDATGCQGVGEDFSEREKSEKAPAEVLHLGGGRYHPSRFPVGVHSTKGGRKGVDEAFSERQKGEKAQEKVTHPGGGRYHSSRFPVGMHPVKGGCTGVDEAFSAREKSEKSKEKVTLPGTSQSGCRSCKRPTTAEHPLTLGR